MKSESTQKACLAISCLQSRRVSRAGFAIRFPFSVDIRYVFSLILGILSHIGDLIQSICKREFEIKDSSSLIPGHGGVYDRVDSLVFLTPFYLVTLKYYYF